MTFYDNDERTMFLEFVHNTEKAINWVNLKGVQWTHAMIYDRRTRAKINRIKNEK
jgi:hypothetical protein